MPPVDLKVSVLDGKNKEIVKCQYCGSKILEKNAANYKLQKFDLPLMQQKESEMSTVTEPLQDFFQVNDMYTFENVGFTYTVDDKKYLSCADCERGPIGYHEIGSKISFVALARVVC